eukprot:CAMPEP_0172393810 /NCGR_PEP_ID=MMETSP1061-20121228/12258_1 /TAXON_ID=37318 /ORGANISM="Pseudo-nitzschia pungens, Strain cf. pungens" /LENGTH=392 /DNA_ID=CAMNT_0013125015 /DNA_START=350 /DNA_END=1529 /DNA_ORIENTATION=-
MAGERHPDDIGSSSRNSSWSQLRAGSDATAEDNRNKNKASQHASRFLQYCNKNYFLVGMLVAVAMARAFPALGKNGGILRPEVVIGNYGVALIFLLSGFSLQTSDLARAVSNVKLNGLVNLLLFGVWPFCIGLPLRYLFVDVLPRWILSPALADGLLITTTLPTTVNMCIMLTSTGGGNTASAICNAVLSNLGGIVLTPLLLLRFFGATTIQLPLGKMVLELCQKVLLPVTTGQLFRTSGSARAFYKKHAPFFKRLQETILLGIVWNAFCNAFSKGLGAGTGGNAIGLGHTLVLMVLLPVLHLAALGASFRLVSLPVLGFTRGERIAAMFCASQKTLAFGLPLIHTVFRGNPNLASYCAPLMILHPLQMAIGSVLLPKIQAYTSGGDNDNDE